MQRRLITTHIPRPKKIAHFKLTEFLNTSGTKSCRVTGTKQDATPIRKNFSDKSDAWQEQADLEMEMAGKPEPRRTTSLFGFRRMRAEWTLWPLNKKSPMSGADFSEFPYGAAGRIRTDDLLITNELLYP